MRVRKASGCSTRLRSGIEGNAEGGALLQWQGVWNGDEPVASGSGVFRERPSTRQEVAHVTSRDPVANGPLDFGFGADSGDSTGKIGPDDCSRLAKPSEALPIGWILAG